MDFVSRLFCRVKEIHNISLNLNKSNCDFESFLIDSGWQKINNVWSKVIECNENKDNFSFILMNNGVYRFDLTPYMMNDDWEEDEIRGLIEEWNLAYQSVCNSILSIDFELVGTEIYSPENSIWIELKRSKFKGKNLSIWVFQDEFSHYVPTVQLGFQLSFETD